MPRDFLTNIVRPNLAEFEAEFGSERRAFNAIAALDALAAHMFQWCKRNKQAAVVGVADDSDYRARLAGLNSDFRLLRDIAKASKHVELTRGNPSVKHSSQVDAEGVPFGGLQY